MALQQHGLAGAGRRDDQAALALAERRHQVHDARRQVLGLGLELDALERIERRQVLEEQLLARLVGGLEVDGLDLDQREVALPFLGRPDLARHRVAGLQVELANLRRGHVDVVRAGQVVVVGGAQEAEAVGQHFEHAFREDEAALLGLGLEDLEDQLLLAHPGRAGDLQVLGDLGEMLDAHLLQLVDVEPGLLALVQGMFGRFGGHIGLGWGLVTATAVGTVTLVTGHAGYSKKGLARVVRFWKGGGATSASDASRTRTERNGGKTGRNCR